MRRSLTSMLVASCLLVLTACATTPAGYYPGGGAMRGVTDPHADASQQSRLVDCNVPSGHRLAADPASVRAGDTVELRHSFEFSAYGPQHIPLVCVDHWQIDPPELATLSEDRRTLRVSEAAVPGSEIRVTVTASGYPYTLAVPVLADGQAGILGNWQSLPSQSCYGSPAPREIHFGQDGLALFALGLGASVWDESRTFMFDGASGVLNLDEQSGTVRFDNDGHLVITGLRLPSAMAPAARPSDAQGYYEAIDWSNCQLTFRRTSTFR